MRVSGVGVLNHEKRYGQGDPTSFGKCFVLIFIILSAIFLVVL